MHNWLIGSHAIFDPIIQDCILRDYDYKILFFMEYKVIYSKYTCTYISNVLIAIN